MPQRLKRIVVYISEDQHRELKSRLALLGLDVSEWFRRKVRQFLEGKD